MARIEVIAYDPSWPEVYQHIRTKLESYLKANNVIYEYIDHVGSTSIPGMPAKNNIDVIIVVSDEHQAQKAKEALIHEPSPEEYYKCYGDGGIRGRISMKLQDSSIRPQQSVYIIRDDDGDLAGQLSIRGYQALRDTLRRSEYKELKKRYAEVKLAMSDEGIEDSIEYGRRKNGIIRQILKAAGWSDEEVDAKEELDYRVSRGPPSPEY